MFEKRKFEKKYGIKLNRMKVYINNIYTYPFKIEVHDKQLMNGEKGPIEIKACNILYAENYIVVNSNRDDFNKMVESLMNNGYEFDIKEDDKAEKKAEKYQIDSNIMLSSNIDQVYKIYKNSPYDFEVYCKRLLEESGYKKAELTERTGDGGFDIKGITKDGETYICECKCYARENKVGRPEIMKLVGANAIEKADMCIFMTTSTYTEDALSYGMATGVKMLSGDDLKAIVENMK